MYLRKISLGTISLRFGGGYTAIFPSVGLEKGPLELRNRKLNLKIIYSEKDENKINELVGRVCDELKETFRLELESQTVKKISQSNLIEELDKESTIDEKTPINERPVYLVIAEKGLKYDINAPYYKIKRLLLSKRILSQIVTRETLHDPRKMGELTTFRNSALSIFVKLGNIPWHLSRPIMLDYDSDETLIIGVGLTSIPEGLFSKVIRRYIGYFSFYNSRGVWGKLYPLFSTQDELTQKINQQLTHGIDEAITAGVNKIDIIIHYTGKELKIKEEQAIEKTLKKYSADKKIQINYAVVRLIKNSIYRMVVDNQNGYVPVGVYLDFENGLLLVNTTGLLGRKATPLGVNTPILASLRLTNMPITTEFKHNVAYSIIGLARMNWRGVSAFNFEPASTKYAREIAYTLARLGEDVYQEETIRRFIEEKMWFI